MNGNLKRLNVDRSGDRIRLVRRRLGVYATELAPAAATIAIAIVTSAIDPTYGFYLVLVAGFVAYSFTQREVIALHLGLIALAMIAPIVLDPQAAREALSCALIFGPGVVLVSAVAAYLRRTHEATDRAYREFANDAAELAARIRSRLGTGPQFEPPAPLIPTPATNIAPPANYRLPLTAFAIAAAVLALVATTTAMMRGERAEPITAQEAPALALDSQPAARSHRTTASTRHEIRRHRGGSAPVVTEATIAAPATPGATTAQVDSGDPVGSTSVSPAPTAGGESPVQARPQAVVPEPTAPAPTRVNQGAPAGPIESAVNVVQQNVAPLVPDLNP